MTVNDFKNADEMEQLEAVWDGKYLGQKIEGNYLIKLHFVDFFYVEEYFDVEKDVRVKFEALHENETSEAYKERFN